MAKGGRPSKREKINYAGLELCYRRGFTDKEVALALQITDRTLDNWKKKDPEFFRSLKDWKASADHNVKRSLYERATGYSHPDLKVQIVDGEWKEFELIKYYPPDTTAAIFWLKNRDPENWRDKQEIDFDPSGHLMGAVVAALKGDK